MNQINGRWIDPAHAGDIPKLLDQALAGPNKPALAWVGIKEPGNRTVHAKGRNGQTAELQWEPRTFSEQIKALAEQWDGDSPTGHATDSGMDTQAIYARRRQAMNGPDESATPMESVDGLPDPESVYARRTSRVSQPADETD